MITTAPFTLGDFTIKPVEHSLQAKSGAPELLQAKFVEVLSYLAQRYPDLVTRDELIDNIWDGNRYVGEKALTNAIWHIRKKLHINGDEYIQTVRKGGYRLLFAPVYLEHQQPSVSSQAPTTTDKLRYYKGGYLLASLVFVVLLIGFFYQQLSLTGVKTATISAVTSSPGREIFPAVSPDGRRLVYYWKQTNKDPDLYIKDLLQPSLAPEQITFDSDRESRPVWGADGKAIYYVQKSWQKDRCHIVRLDLQTKNQTRLGTCKPFANGALSMANKGQLLAYNGIDDSNDDVGIYLLNLALDKPVAERISCQTNCLFSDRDAVFSPNDQLLAFTRRAQPYEEDIFLFDLQTRQATRLTTGQTDIHGMAWHPGGGKVIYSAEIANQRNGYILDINTKTITRLNIPGFSFPSFVKGTNKVVYHDWKMRNYIGSLPLADDIQSVPFPVIQSEFNHKDVDFSEVRQQIVYISNESGSNEVWLANSDGTGRKQLTELNQNVSAPRWSHQGNKIAFLIRQTATDRNAIYILDLYTKQVSLLPSELNSFGTPSWSLDDQSLLVEASNDQQAQLYRIALDGSETVLAEVTAVYAMQTKLDEIWYSVDDLGLFRRNLTDIDAEVELVLPATELASLYSWLVTDNQLYFLKNFANHQEVAVLDLTTDSVSSLLKMPLRTLDRNTPLSINKAQQTLIFSQSQSMNVDIKMLEHPLLNE